MGFQPPSEVLKPSHLRKKNTSFAKNYYNHPKTPKPMHTLSRLQPLSLSEPKLYLLLQQDNQAHSQDNANLHKNPCLAKSETRFKPIKTLLKRSGVVLQGSPAEKSQIQQYKTFYIQSKNTSGCNYC